MMRFGFLKDIRYKGHAVIEVEDKTYVNSFESRKQAICQSRNFVKQVIGCK